MSETLELRKLIASGSTVALAKAITLAESSLKEHRTRAEALLKELLPISGNSLRLGISGPPGVGKSSFIEALGLKLIASGCKVAVLAVDPTSPVTGGSILGDKTRMLNLANHKNAYIRPSPSSGVQGGVARRTRESIILCEAAGYNIVLIETVGVGQSDIAVSEMTDFFIQLHQPKSGDELQGIKKGASEFADFILVTKADGDLKDAADIAKTELEQSFHYLADGRRSPEILAISAKTDLGINDLVQKIRSLESKVKGEGAFELRRRKQQSDWFDEEISIQLDQRLRESRTFKSEFEKHTDSIFEGQEIAPVAARILIDTIFKSV